MNFHYLRRLPSANYWLLCLLLLSAVSCGRKDDIRPPEEYAPAPVVQPEFAWDGATVVLRWLPPADNASGEELLDLAYFEVQRRALRKQIEEAEFETIGTVPHRSEQAETTMPVYSFTDSDVVPGEIYQYVLIPVNEDDVKGVPAVLRVDLRQPELLLPRQ